jgi:hypothetical protein
MSAFDYLWLAGGTFDSAGVVELFGTSATALAGLLVGDASTVNLTGTGSIEMLIGGPVDSNLITDNPIGAEFGSIGSINNQTETISGTGTIGGDLNFTNGLSGLIETNNNTSSSGGTLAIEGSAAGGSFVNNGQVIAQNGGRLILGEDNQTGTIVNNETIELDSSGAFTGLEIAGNLTISGTPGDFDTIILTGATNADAGTYDELAADGPPATLTLVNQTLKGAGYVGSSNLTLNNQSLIDADDPGQTLDLYTGSNTITNNAGATLEANEGTLNIASELSSELAIVQDVPHRFPVDAGRLHRHMRALVFR